MNPYDDDKYIAWCVALNRLVAEYLNTEGNDEQSLRDEIDNAIENAEVDE